ncbi:hypothetical protein [Rhodohalobacter barkolensis]|uniref:Porin n=1 Tax=Rhodohalobacter barkolensis TaxID=2053187 RepID=A0A2N0VFE7_9BACT|nr:hypothetical protein [Rhodohalobacter barkolensis]PKD42916.1 hypothetical protein CWD77_12750 [Rhodohalobacter barkolensis]
MKTTIMTMAVLIASLLVADFANAQSNRDLQYFRAPDQTGINVFETSKDTDVEFDGFNLRIGGANTLQFQALTNETGPDLHPNFNLATSNLDIDAQLANGLRMHLRTYLSSRHHAEAWVKGGYIQMDRLDFIQEDFMAGLMDMVTIKVGHMEINYGDAHFRRTDNGQAIYNPFVGNYLMDSFTTEVGGEIYVQNNGLLAMFGLTNGKLNQSTIEGATNTRASIVAKLGYDSQINEDLRFRLTGSIYHTGQAARTYLYSGDRAGSRYYNVVIEGNDFSGRFNPGFNNEMTAIQINPFVKFQGLEFFGVMEFVSGKGAGDVDTRSVAQYGGELIYRFGASENVYLGGRYNVVTGDNSANEDIDITRLNIGGGWFMTKNVLAKLEYVTQSYDGFSDPDFSDAGFDGVMLEAVISF